MLLYSLRGWWNTVGTLVDILLGPHVIVMIIVMIIVIIMVIIVLMIIVVMIMVIIVIVVILIVVIIVVVILIVDSQAPIHRQRSCTIHRVR